MDLLERINLAIDDFVEDNGNVQNCISLPEKEFKEYKDIVMSTDLGRSFGKGGLFYCTLPVTVNTGHDIIVLAKDLWK